MNGKTDNLSNLRGLLKDVDKKSRNPALDALRIEEVPCENIYPNPNQPRKRFTEAALNELAESITQHGVMQPIVLRKAEDGRYEIIAGERRWRAAQRAGLVSIPARIRSISDTEKQILALIENIQRENLTTVEEADSVALLVNELGSQHEAATKLNKDKEHISKMCSIAALPLFARDAYDKEILGDDAELLVNLVRLNKVNTDYAEKVIQFAQKPGDLTRPYVRDILKRAKENLEPVSPAEWLSQRARPTEPELPRTADPTRVRSPIRPSEPAGVHDSTYGFTSAAPGSLTIEVRVPSMRIKRAFLDLERMPDKPDQVWIVDGSKRICADLSEIELVRVVPKL